MYDTHDTGKPLKFVCMQYNPEGRGLLMFKTFFINLWKAVDTDALNGDNFTVN